MKILSFFNLHNIKALILKLRPMTIFYYFLFFAISWFLLMLIFRYSTYHKYFKVTLIPLIAYGVLVGYLLFKFNLNSFFLWHLGLSIVLFFYNYSKQKKAVALTDTFEDELMKKSFELSIEKTLRYYILSSFIFLSAFSASFLYFYNQYN